MKEEKTLSEKRKELFEVIENLEYAEFDEVELRIDKIEQIKSLIKSQDKEFIKEILDEIDKEKYDKKIDDRESPFWIIDVWKIKKIIKQKSGFEDL